MIPHNNAPCSYRRFLKLATCFLTMLMLWVFSGACSRKEQMPAVPREKVTVAYAMLTEAALALVAQAKGYYREEGLDVTIHQHSYGKLALEELLDGKVDFATVAETPVMLAILNGEKISILATIQNSQMNHAIIARKDKGILSPQDLKGRKIATTLGTTADFFMDGYLASQGISRQEMQVVNLKPAELQHALVNGDLAAVAAFYPFLHETQKILGDKGITFYDKDIYTSTFNMVTRQETARNNPDRIRKMLRALVKAEAFVRGNPLAAQKIVAEVTGMDPVIVHDIWANSSFEVELDQALILVLEDESQWAIKRRVASSRDVPNYLDYIYFDGLTAVKPAAVRILR
jgi:NitT/TauT family transport system substrate-binding protein